MVLKREFKFGCMFRAFGAFTDKPNTKQLILNERTFETSILSVDSLNKLQNEPTRCVMRDVNLRAVTLFFTQLLFPVNKNVISLFYLL